MGVLISMLCALLASGFGALIYSVLTITLRANQNVTGLALTTFGVGFGNFFGGSLSQLAGGVGQISVAVTGGTYRTKIPGLSKIPVIGDVLFSYGFMTYFGIILAILVSWFMYKSRKGLNLRAVGESPATADAAGINVTLYKYLATIIVLLGSKSCQGSPAADILSSCISLWNIQAVHGPTTVSVTEAGWPSPLLSLHCGSLLTPSGDLSSLVPCISSTSIYRGLAVPCRRYSRCCHTL